MNSENNIRYISGIIAIIILLSLWIDHQYAEKELQYIDNNQIKTIKVYRKHLETTESVLNRSFGKEYKQTVNCSYAGLCIGSDLEFGFHAVCNGYQEVMAQIIQEIYIEHYTINSNNKTTTFNSPQFIREYENITKRLSQCH